MNVSKEADAVFMSDLEKVDPPRYRNLIRNMHKAVAKTRGEAVCENPGCNASLTQFRAGTRFCSEACKKQVTRVLDRKIAA